MCDAKSRKYILNMPTMMRVAAFEWTPAGCPDAADWREEN